MELDFTKLDGLLPAVIQDAGTGEVLMLGFMNAEAYAATQASGEVTFFSRSRNKLWRKGEQSGHVLRVREIRVDCDVDALLIRVERSGPAFATKAIAVVLLPAAFSGRRGQGGGRAHVRSRTRFTERMRADERTSPGNSQGQLAGCDGAAVRARPDGGSRSIRAAIFPAIDDPEINCMLVRAQEMARYVETARSTPGSPAAIGCLRPAPNVAEIGGTAVLQAKPRAGALGAGGAGGRRRCNR